LVPAGAAPIARLAGAPPPARLALRLLTEDGRLLWERRIEPAPIDARVDFVAEDRVRVEVPATTGLRAKLFRGAGALGGADAEQHRVELQSELPALDGLRIELELADGVCLAHALAP